MLTSYDFNEWIIIKALSPPQSIYIRYLRFLTITFYDNGYLTSIILLFHFSYHYDENNSFSFNLHNIINRIYDDNNKYGCMVAKINIVINQKCYYHLIKPVSAIFQSFLMIKFYDCSRKCYHLFQIRFRSLTFYDNVKRYFARSILCYDCNNYDKHEAKSSELSLNQPPTPKTCEVWKPFFSFHFY